MSHKQETTIAPVQVGDLTRMAQEFGRIADVTRLFGLRRGTIYGLLALGRIKGVLLRVRGAKSGIRLIDIDSVRRYIRESQNEQEAA